MRDEIREPQEWRNSTFSKNARSMRHRQHELNAEAVDAALEQDSEHNATSEVNSQVADQQSDKNDAIQSDIIASLSTQLVLLEAQREQLQKLLDQAQG